MVREIPRDTTDESIRQALEQADPLALRPVLMRHYWEWTRQPNLQDFNYS